MKNLTDDKIHLYILNPAMLPKEDINLIKGRIETDQEFRNYVDDIKNFHLKLNEFDTSVLDIDRITSKVLKKYQFPNIINLISIFDEKDPGESIKLAAMKNLKIENEYKYFNTYASAEKFVLIRVLKNQSSNEYKFFLICDDMNKVVNAYIKFNGMYFIADEYGVVNIQSEYLTKDIDIKIQIPVARYEINLKSINEKYLSEISGIISEAEIKMENGKLLIKFRSDFSKPVKAIVVYDKEYSSFKDYELNGDGNIFIDIPDDDISQIKILLLEKSF